MGGDSSHEHRLPVSSHISIHTTLVGGDCKPVQLSLIHILTHNMQQAARISDKTAFFLLGDMVEFGETEQIFSMPKDHRTEDYITGRFG